MTLSVENAAPIYIQLVQQIKEAIISGDLQPGERLPSVRDLALQNKVNPNTMQKALLELETTGLIYTERTNGKFVTTDKVRIEQERAAFAAAVSAQYRAQMARIGFGPADILTYLTKGENK